MAGRPRISPRLEAVIVFAAVILAAALGAFVKSQVTGQPFSLDWRLALVAGAACAAVSYLGPPLLYRLKQAMREKQNQ